MPEELNGDVMPISLMSERLSRSHKRLRILCKEYRNLRSKMEELRHVYELELSYYRRLDRQKAEQDGRWQQVPAKKPRKATQRTRAKAPRFDLEKLLVGLSCEQQNLVKAALRKQDLI